MSRVSINRHGRTGAKSRLREDCRLGSRGQIAQGLAVRQIDLGRVDAVEELVELAFVDELENLSIERRERAPEILIQSPCSRRLIGGSVRALGPGSRPSVPSR